MRKFSTFLIVLIIQIAIIYGLYKWYVSYEDETLQVEASNNYSKPTLDTTNVPKQKDILPTKAITNSNQKIDHSLIDEIIETANNMPKKGEANKKTSTKENVVAQTDKTKDDKIASWKPLIYKDADWNDISTLKRSKGAYTGILVDINTRKVLWAKKCRKSVSIASMTKMMTVLLTFKAIQKGAISLNTVIPVTNEAYRIGGSQVWLDPREKFSLKELLKTVMISSANDSSYLIAQYLGDGDVNNFVKKMNIKAKEIHMPNAHFSNPDGLPETYATNDNRATAEGLVFLAEKLLQYPLVGKWATTKLDYFRENTKKEIMLTNTNRLVRENFPGITGMKTGYIRRSGFCLTATCNRNGQKLIAVVTGFKSSRERNKFVGNLLNWGYKKLAPSSPETK